MGTHSSWCRRPEVAHMNQLGSWIYVNTQTKVTQPNLVSSEIWVKHQTMDLGWRYEYIYWSKRERETARARDRKRERAPDWWFGDSSSHHIFLLSNCKIAYLAVLVGCEDLILLQHGGCLVSFVDISSKFEGDRFGVGVLSDGREFLKEFGFKALRRTLSVIYAGVGLVTTSFELCRAKGSKEIQEPVCNMLPDHDKLGT